MMNHKKYAPVVLRLGMCAVVAWFGASQLSNPNMWFGVVPAWALEFSHLSAQTIIRLNGWFEIIAALALGVGVFTRWVALALSAHLFVIALGFGLSAVGVRDFGLTFGLLAVAMFGADCLCFEDVAPPLAV